MLAWVDRLGGTLIDASLATTVLFCLVALAMLGCRQPVRRICLARAAILCGLAMLPLVALAPIPRVDVSGVVRRSSLGLHPLFADSRALPPTTTSTAVEGRNAGGPGPSRLVLLSRMLGAPTRVLVALYLAGVACGLAWLVLGYWGLGWLTRLSEPPSPASLDLYGSLPYKRVRPRLRVSSRVRRPVLVGVLRQTILIPADLDMPETGQALRLSLLHELAHAKRRDPVFGLGSSLCQSFWFFLPPLWWIRAQMRLDQEFIADRSAAESFGPLQSYASSLVKIASQPVEGTAAPSRGALASGGRASALFQRVLMLVQCPFPVESCPPRWWGWSLPGLVALGTMAASSLSLRSLPLPPGPDPLTRVRAGTPRTFRMAKLVVEAAKDCHTRSTFFELPIRLPESFELTLQIWGDRDSLSRTRVVGRRLSLPATPGVESSPEAWHVVRIKRGPDGLTIWVDEHALAPDSFDGTTTWLSVDCPNDRPSQFRGLVLIW
jgi:beta-lactamase regulating signal transducer with metallopeptidase domain